MVVRTVPSKRESSERAGATCNFEVFPEGTLTEKDIDQKIVAYAKRLGWFSLKLTMLGRYGVAGVPDRLFLASPGIVFFMEMKRRGKSPTELQSQRHEQLRRLGFSVYVCDSVEEGERIVERHTAIAHAMLQ